MDLYLRGIHLAEAELQREEDEPAAELLFTNAHLQVEVIAGDPDPDNGDRRSIEGFYLVATESTPDGEAAPDGVRVRLPMDVGAAQLLASSLLDYLERHEVKGSDLTLATAEDVVHLGRAQRRLLERKGR